MRFIGTILLVLGILSSVLYLLHMNFIFLHWIDRWGQTTGWMIRGGMLVIGFILYITGKPSDEE